MIAGSKFSEWQMGRPWHIRAARLQSGPKLYGRPLTGTYVPNGPGIVCVGKDGTDDSW